MTPSNNIILDLVDQRTNDEISIQRCSLARSNNIDMHLEVQSDALDRT